MSIYEEIVRKVNDGELVLVRPLLDEPDHVRRMYVSREINDELLLAPPREDMKWYERCIQLRFDLDYFSQGMKLTVDFRSRREKASQLAQIEPSRDEIWVLRSRAAIPSIRLFG